MARPIEYNKVELLDTIMHLFWQKGYESVSVEDIMSKAKFNRNSFYKLFKHKDGAYHAALDHYIQSGKQEMVKALNNKKGLVAIKKLFELNVQKFEHTNGCLILNTLNTDIDMDKKAYHRAKEQVEEFEMFMQQLVKQAQERKEISTRKNPTVLASLLITTLFGVRFKLKNGYSKQKCKAILDELVTEVAT